ncbi:MAG: hypothetical protein RL148_444 [Planctomycetota bacterium]
MITTFRLPLARMFAAIGPADWTGFSAAAADAAAAGVHRSEAEEALLQATLFFGFPRVVTAFETLQRCWPQESAPGHGALPPGAQAGAGRALFDAIYDRNAPTVHALLQSFHPDFHEFVVECAYGRVLARPGLGPMVRELLAVAGLAALQQVPQLVAHARGAVRFGATLSQVRDCMAAGGVEGVPADELLSRISRAG